MNPGAQEQFMWLAVYSQLPHIACWLSACRGAPKNMRKTEKPPGMPRRLALQRVSPFGWLRGYDGKSRGRWSSRSRSLPLSLYRLSGVHRREPAMLVGARASDDSEELVLQRLGHGSAFAFADRD